jgi:AraC-like DNA-binding protein
MVPDQREYAEWPARRSPRDAVACVWAAPPKRTAPSLVLPDACIDIIWDGSALFVAGPDTGPVPIEDQPGPGYAGIRFLPGKAPGFLGASAGDLLDLRVELAELWGRADADRLEGRLASAATMSEAAQLLDDAVAERSALANDSDPLVDALIAWLRAQPPSFAAVHSVSRELDVGQRRLHRRCSAAVGYGPKTLERVLRFQRAITMASRASSLADLAYRAGYSDQAHLSRECRRLAGMTPSDLFKTAGRAAA